MTELPAARGPAVWQALRLSSRPEAFLRRCGARGDPFTVRLPGLGAVLVTGHPEGARDVFGAPPDTFEPLLPNPIEPLLGPGSLILLGGERHGRERKLLMPPFHGDRMRAYGRIMRDLAREALGRMVPGRPSSAQALAREITLGTIVRAVFGVQDHARQERFRATIVAALERYTGPLLVLPALRRRFLGLGPWARFVRARGALVALLSDEIACRRREGARGREDILSLLLEARHEDGSPIAEADLLDQLGTLLVAGHDTTATALAWALHFSLSIPEVGARLERELAALGPEPAPEALAQAEYLGAVCSEALRLHPVVPVIVRRTRAPFSLRGHDVPVGQAVAVAVTLLHEHPSVWSEPGRFLPERFLGRRHAPYELAPFGGGARRCVGAAFATYELRIVLGTLLAEGNFAHSTAQAPQPVLHGITMTPRRPLPIVVSTGAC